ncbi:MAG: hypothetical protein IKB98_03230 [Clostridia bacterium]|nr:hypothetical protein [Clostridia bacterium]
MVNWDEIRDEYILTDASYRDLQIKYKVHRNTIMARSKKEKWVEAKKKVCDRQRTLCDTQKSLVPQTVTTAVKRKESTTMKYFTLCDKLMARITRFIDEANKLTATDLKSLTGAIKDLQQCQGIKSERDIREQEARIAKLIKDTESSEQKAQEIVVKIDKELEEFGE